MAQRGSPQRAMPYRSVTDHTKTDLGQTCWARPYLRQTFPIQPQRNPHEHIRPEPTPPSRSKTERTKPAFRPEPQLTADYRILSRLGTPHQSAHCLATHHQPP